MLSEGDQETPAVFVSLLVASVAPVQLSRVTTRASLEGRFS
jgi:hypothetical protein